MQHRIILQVVAAAIAVRGRIVGRDPILVQVNAQAAVVVDAVLADLVLLRQAAHRNAVGGVALDGVLFDGVVIGIVHGNAISVIGEEGRLCAIHPDYIAADGVIIGVHKSDSIKRIAGADIIFDGVIVRIVDLDAIGQVTLIQLAGEVETDPVANHAIAIAAAGKRNA